MERHIDGETYRWRDEVMTLQRIGEMERWRNEEIKR
jgi:hypothetical protein